VAKIQSIVYSPGEAFAKVSVKPFAKLDQSRHVLLLFSEERQQIARIKEDTLDEENSDDERAALNTADANNESAVLQGNNLIQEGAKSESSDSVGDDSQAEQ
jgi:cell shape-determining protein MreC